MDDEPRILSALRHLLENEPYELVTTSDPDEALQTIVQRRVSLVVADQRMPGMSGTDLLRIVRDRSPSTGRMILTAYPDIHVVLDAVNRCEILRLMIKPWDDEGLKQAIEEILRRQEQEGCVAHGHEGSRTTADLHHEETVLRIDCRERTSESLLGLLEPFIDGRDPSRHLVLILEGVSRMSGKVVPFMAKLYGRLLRCGVRACIIDPSGAASALLRMIGGDLTNGPGSVEAPATGRVQQVLVVESRVDSLRFVRAAFEAAGHRVDRARSADVPRDAFPGRRYDVILDDVPVDDAFDPPAGVEIPRVVLEVTPLPCAGAEAARLRVHRRIRVSACLGRLLATDRERTVPR